MLAAAVGAVAIAAVIFGSSDQNDKRDGLVPTIFQPRQRTATKTPGQEQAPLGLKWSTPKTDKLQLAASAPSARHIIHESMRQRRAGREYIQNKPYARIVARLAGAPIQAATKIPAFNPYRLYASATPVSESSEQDAADQPADVAIRVVELLGGILPGEDGQEMDPTEVAEIVQRSQDPASSIRPAFQAEGAENINIETSEQKAARSAPEPLPVNTTVLQKGTQDLPDDTDDELDQEEVKVVRVLRGETLMKALTRAGAEPWAARAMAEAAREQLPDSALTPGHEVHLSLIPSLTQTNKLEATRFSVFGEGHNHKLSVTRSAAGEFVASLKPLMPSMARLDAAADDQETPVASIYTSLYVSALQQGVSPETIMQILRVHAYETDYRRRVLPTDTLELFFDLKEEEKGADSALGDMLATSISIGGETRRYFRYRAADGSIDYYDENGQNSRKFLMRQPIRGEGVRLTSGYGIRLHPVLNTRKMHTGVDWSAAPGTPILAAGNGVVEEADRKGQYGNYVRIRHANGYRTAYGHMSRFAEGMREGIKIRQGQVIGYVGTTGLSSGPHLHYEVLINNSFVDPMRIEVPRDRRLSGRDLAEFQKERRRIEDLMRRPPVMTKLLEANLR